MHPSGLAFPPRSRWESGLWRCIPKSKSWSHWAIIVRPWVGCYLSSMSLGFPIWEKCVTNPVVENKTYYRLCEACALPSTVFDPWEVLGKRQPRLPSLLLVSLSCLRDPDEFRSLHQRVPPIPHSFGPNFSLRSLCALSVNKGLMANQLTFTMLCFVLWTEQKFSQPKTEKDA